MDTTDTATATNNFLNILPEIKKNRASHMNLQHKQIKSNFHLPHQFLNATNIHSTRTHNPISIVHLFRIILHNPRGNNFISFSILS